MNWLLVSIISYFINAGVYVADKFLLSKRIHSSIAYAFYVGIWSIFNFLILFLAPWLPSFKEMIIDLSAGLLFLATLVFWYKALHQSEATRVVPVVGALIPIFSFTLSFIFLGDRFSLDQFLAFIILIAGGVLISIKRTRFYFFNDVRERILNFMGDTFGLVSAELRPTRRLIINSVISAFFFAAYYVLMKYIYNNQPFIGSFVWSRFGSFIGSLLILVIPKWRASIKEARKETNDSVSLGFFLVVRVAAALAFIMLNWAISLGSVAMTNALQGVQYLFLIIIVLILSARFPKILKEELGRGVLLQKIVGVVLVSFGLYLLTIPAIDEIVLK